MTEIPKNLHPVDSDNVVAAAIFLQLPPALVELAERLGGRLLRVARADAVAAAVRSRATSR